MRWSVTYAQVEGVLARLHGATGDVQKKAFRGRLKHLKRLGIPQGINPGRGAKIFYFEEQLYEWAFCLELAEFGLDPTVIVKLMKEKWTDEIYPCFNEETSFDNADPLYFVAYPNLMSAAWSNPPEVLPFKWIKHSKSDRSLRKRRTIRINVTQLCRDIGLARVTVDSAIKFGPGTV